MMRDYDRFASLFTPDGALRIADGWKFTERVNGGQVRRLQRRRHVAGGLAAQAVFMTRKSAGAEMAVRPPEPLLHTRGN